MNLRFIDWIWRVRGSLALPDGQSDDEAFERLDPLFRQPGTTYQRSEGVLTFHKKDQAAQDKMSIFDRGVLRIERHEGAAVLRFDMLSRALLFCFLAPLLFIGFAQLTIALDAAKKPPTEASEPAKKKAELPPMNPVDKFLGAPAPEKPDKADGEKGGKRRRKPSSTAAYVFAGIFAALYVIGRILEDRLIRRQFRRKLFGE